MKAVLLFAASVILAATSPRTANRPDPVGCPAAIELFRQYVSTDSPRDLFSASALIRLYGESAEGKDLGHKDLTLEEFRSLAGAVERFSGRHGHVRCERDGENWLVTAQRLSAKPAPVSFLIGVERGALRILSASFVRIAD